MSDVNTQRDGARTVELLIPYESNGHKIDSITLGPYVFDHTLRWRKADYKDWFTMMVDMSSCHGRQLLEEDVRLMRYPDVDRVTQNFIEMLPQDIKEALATSSWPEKVKAPPPPLPVDNHPPEEPNQRAAYPMPPPPPGSEAYDEWARQPDDGLSTE
jgi:hypothetical protein